MKRSGRPRTCLRALVVVLVLLMAVPPAAFGQQAAPQAQAFEAEELEQILAPIALYPDSLLAQILMAATYPLEVVQAERWAKQNPQLKAEALTAALEKEPWDPSVKSLVNFPDVLSMMNEQLDWTQKLGDAFLAQQKDVMDTVQKLRARAQEAGNLKTTEQQKVIVEKETIIIQPASPQVVYVPSYNPTMIYGGWPYPAYPPYAYYPPGYVAGAALFSFGVGVAIGAAWGYAWGGCNWRRGDIDININRNTNINRNINRGNYARQYQGGRGNWQHNPQHRMGVSYRDQGTAQRYNRASTNEAIRSRENFRGRAEAGRQDIARGGADQLRSRQGTGQLGKAQVRSGFGDAGGRAGSAQARAGSMDSGRRSSSSQRGGAFSGMDRSGGATRQASSRGSSSYQRMSPGSRGGGRGGGRR